MTTGGESCALSTAPPRGYIEELLGGHVSRDSNPSHHNVNKHTYAAAPPIHILRVLSQVILDHTIYINKWLNLYAWATLTGLELRTLCPIVICSLHCTTKTQL